MAKLESPYFFLNGELHKALRINRSDDTIETWAYPSARRVSYSYSTVKRNMERAWSTPEVASMLQRHRITIERAVRAKEIPEPPIAYTRTGNVNAPNKKRWMWRESDIMAMHKALASHGKGPARSDGTRATQKIPSANEVRAMIRHNLILYVKTDDGFVPTWDAEQF